MTTLSMNQAHHDRNEMAKSLDVQVSKLLLNATERAFEVGKIFTEINKKELFKELGFSSFQEYASAKKMRRSTVYANMRIAEKFDIYAHGHIGVSKLRLLSKAENPIKLIKEGLAVIDSQGNQILKNIEDLSYRELKAALNNYKAPLQDPLHSELVGALTPILPPPIDHASDELTSVEAITTEALTTIPQNDSDSNLSEGSEAEDNETLGSHTADSNKAKELTTEVERTELLITKLQELQPGNEKQLPLFSTMITEEPPTPSAIHSAVGIGRDETLATEKI